MTEKTATDSETNEGWDPLFVLLSFFDNNFSCFRNQTMRFSHCFLIKGNGCTDAIIQFKKRTGGYPVGLQAIAVDTVSAPAADVSCF